jgi:hypothetical protein
MPAKVVKDVEGYWTQNIKGADGKPLLPLTN